MEGKVAGAYLLTSRQSPLTVTPLSQAVEIQLPTSPPDPIASVVVAEVPGEIRPFAVDTTTVVTQAADGSIVLRANDAEISGETARIESSGLNANIGFWTDAKDKVRWKARVTRPGSFRVSVIQACASGTEGSEYSVTLGDQKLTGTVAATGDWKTYKQLPLGTIRISQPGTIVIQVIPEVPKGYAVMNLRGLELRPEVP
jgi:hypothetical protein